LELLNLGSDTHFYNNLSLLDVKKIKLTLIPICCTTSIELSPRTMKEMFKVVNHTKWKWKAINKHKDKKNKKNLYIIQDK